MNANLLEKLKALSEEEKIYIGGETERRDAIYNFGDKMEIDSELFLKENKLVTVRKHSRFVNFPEHGHNYVEIMYVCSGEIHHIIDNKELVLREGDLLLLNQKMRHGIRRADYDDIGINFIALPQFFDLPLKMLNSHNPIAEFLIGIFKKNTQPQHLIFNVKDSFEINNLLDNMILSMLAGKDSNPVINQYTMGVLFLYLLNNTKDFRLGGEIDYKELIVLATLRYIDENYRGAALGDLAVKFNMSDSMLSKIIKAKMGYTFRELLINKRFYKAVMLLLETDLTIEDIADRVGYDNLSFFYRRFKSRYGTTPYKYRKKHKNDISVKL